MIYITKKGSKFIIVDKPDGKISKDLPTISLEDFSKKEQIKLLDRIDPKKLLIELRQRLKSSKFKKGVKKLRSSLKSKKIKITNRKLNIPVQPKNVVYPSNNPDVPKVSFKKVPKTKVEREERTPSIWENTISLTTGSPRQNEMREEEEKLRRKPPLPPRKKDELVSLQLPQSQDSKRKHPPLPKPSPRYAKSPKSPKSPSESVNINKNKPEEAKATLSEIEETAPSKIKVSYSAYVPTGNKKENAELIKKLIKNFKTEPERKLPKVLFKEDGEDVKRVPDFIIQGEFIFVPINSRLVKKGILTEGEHDFATTIEKPSFRKWADESRRMYYIAEEGFNTKQIEELHKFFDFNKGEEEIFTDNPEEELKDVFEKHKLPTKEEKLIDEMEKAYAEAEAIKKLSAQQLADALAEEEAKLKAEEEAKEEAKKAEEEKEKETKAKARQRQKLAEAKTIKAKQIAEAQAEELSRQAKIAEAEAQEEMRILKEKLEAETKEAEAKEAEAKAKAEERAESKKRGDEIRKEQGKKGKERVKAKAEAEEEAEEKVKPSFTPSGWPFKSNLKESEEAEEEPAEPKKPKSFKEKEKERLTKSAEKEKTKAKEEAERLGRESIAQKVEAKRISDEKSQKRRERQSKPALEEGEIEEQVKPKEPKELTTLKTQKDVLEKQLQKNPDDTKSSIQLKGVNRKIDEFGKEQPKPPSTPLSKSQAEREIGSGLGGKLNLDEVNAFNKASYAKKKNAEKVGDYVLDRSLSSKENKVYYNPINGKVVIANAGTSGILDWWNNKNILFGNYETTDRYKDLENIQKEAINKYGLKNITNVGHSQSGEALRILANNGLTNEAVALNPAILGKSHEGVDVIRSSRDIPSLFTPMGENDLTIQGESYNPITEHRRDILDRVPNKEVGTGLEDEAWEILEHPHHHNMELVKKAHKHIQSVLKLKSPNNRMVNRQVMSGRGKMIMRHPALQSAESVLNPGAFANLGLGLSAQGGEIGDGLYAGNLKDKLSGMYNKIPQAYHAPIEAIGRQGLHDMGFGLSAQGGAFNLKDKLNNVWHHHIPEQYHPHIEAIGKQALHDVGYGVKQDMNKLDSFLYKMSNFGMGLSHFGNFDRIPEKYRPFAKMGVDELGASMLRSYNPFARGLSAQGGDIQAQYRDTFDPHSEEGGNLKDKLSNLYNKIPKAYHAPIEAIGRQGLKDAGFGLQAQGGKLAKGSPEMKERMAKMRAMKGKKMKGGDLPPRSRSYVTDPSLL